MLNPPYAFWSIWPSLSWLQRLFLLLLCAVGIYCLFAMTSILARLRSRANPKVSSDLPVLYSKNANVGQVIEATFYVFGFVLFLGLQSAQHTLGDGRGSVGLQILQNFQLHFVFGANVFFIFLFLHSAHWFVSTRLRSYSLRLDSGR